MFGIGFGPSGDEKRAFKDLRSLTGFDTQAGENATTKSLNFFSDILSGDPSKTMQTLAPQSGQIQGQGNQAKKTAAEFGNRGGGTNATMASIDEHTRAMINNLIAGLIGTAASNLGSLGTNLLGQAQSGTEGMFAEAGKMAEENRAKWNDIFDSVAKSLTAVAGMPGVGKSLAQGLNSAAGAFG